MVRDQDAVPAAANLACPLQVSQVCMGHDAIALGRTQELGPEAKQAAKRNRIAETDVRSLEVEHLLHGPAPFTQHVDDRSLVLLGNVQDEGLIRLEDLAALLLGDDLWHRNLKLIAFAAYLFNEDRQLEFASSRNGEPVGQIAPLNGDGNVSTQLFLDTLTQLAGGHELALRTSKWTVVDHEHHRDCRRFDCQHVQLHRTFRIGDRVSDRDSRYSCEREDLARLHAGDLLAFQPLEDEELEDLTQVFVFAIGEHLDLVSGLQLSAEHAADADAPNIVVMGDIRYQDRQRTRGVILRSRDLLEHQLEQWRQVLRWIVEVHGRFAVAARSIDDREIQLLFGCVEFDEQVEGLVDDFLDTGILPIDLVDDYNRPEIELESLLEHEPRLRHRPLGGIDQEQNPIHHSQDALHFATKVRVARRVDDVDLNTLPHQRHVLGDNGDAAFPLEVP